MNSNLSINQNFLKNPELISKLVKKVGLNPKNLILDIGVGEGAISEDLIKNNYFVLGFELDEKLFTLSKNKYESYSNFKILNQDFLKYKMDPKVKYSIFSNIPFNQTTKIVQKILVEQPFSDEIFLIMQEDAANRFFGKREGLLISLLILNNYSGEIIYKFKKTDFTPVPKVNIVLTKFKKREKPLVDKENYQKFLDFICYIVMQQKPSIIDRLSKTLNYFSLKEILHSLGLEPYLSLYDIPKLKYFEMFDLFWKKYPMKFDIFSNSYQNYLRINYQNKKIHQTRRK